MPAWPEFALDRKLRSCVVTREFLEQLEKQLISAASDLLGQSASERELKLDISVFDSFGVETFRSASNIPTSGFPETTHAVRIVTESGIEQEQLSFKCKLSFRRRHGNHFLLRLRGPQARERAAGLLERVQQPIDSQAIDGWLFRKRD